MKIISGKYKGRIIDGYDILGTRPTMDRVRESLFATLRPYIKESKVLDLFAGTGSLGLEALSNGAKSAVFVDKNKKCINQIQQTINKINVIEEVELLNKNYKEVLEKIGKFDIIFLDPPYHESLLNDAIKMIEKFDILNDNGLMIVEYEEENPISNYQILKEKKYGNKHIKIYQKKL